MKRVFKNMVLLDGSENMVPRSGYALLVNEDKIEAILPEQEVGTEGCEVIDLQGQYLLPGLVNLHVHIPASGKPRKKPMDAKRA